MSFKIRHLAPVALIVTTMIVGFYVPDIIKQIKSSDQEVHTYCPLSRAACQQGLATITLEDDQLHPLKPSQITVDWPSASPTLLLELQSNQMEMGSYKLLLKRSEQGLYVGDITLPICIENTLEWIGSIKNSDEKVYISVRMN
jgi:hypothetical protein